MTADELQALYHRLDRMDEKLDQVVTTISRRDGICAMSRERLDAVYVAVYGNGREGLQARVTRLETVRRLWATAASIVLGLLSGVCLTVLAWLLGR